MFSVFFFLCYVLNTFLFFRLFNWIIHYIECISFKWYLLHHNHKQFVWLILAFAILIKLFLIKSKFSFLIRCFAHSQNFYFDSFRFGRNLFLSITMYGLIEMDKHVETIYLKYKYSSSCLFGKINKSIWAHNSNRCFVYGF